MRLLNEALNFELVFGVIKAGLKRVAKFASKLFPAPKRQIYLALFKRRYAVLKARNIRVYQPYAVVQLHIKVAVAVI